VLVLVLVLLLSEWTREAHAHHGRRRLLVVGHHRGSAGAAHAHRVVPWEG
jgi:hypothetical protein